MNVGTPPKKPRKGLDTSFGGSGRVSLAAEAASLAACWGWSGSADLTAEAASPAVF